MAWVRFTRDFRWTPSRKRKVTFGFKAGKAYSVPAECKRRAIATESAVEIPTPTRGETPQ
jgi:hypothetical protein